jgi:hypothetical protein
MRTLKSKTLRGKAVPDSGPVSPLMILKPHCLRIILSAKCVEVDLQSEEVREFNRATDRPTGPA